MSRQRTITIQTTKELEQQCTIRFLEDLVDEEGQKLDGCVTHCGDVLIEKRLPSSHKISTLIHELVHRACPDLSEAAVLRIEQSVYRGIKPYLK